MPNSITHFFQLFRLNTRPDSGLLRKQNGPNFRLLMDLPAGDKDEYEFINPGDSWEWIFRDAWKKRKGHISCTSEKL